MARRRPSYFERIRAAAEARWNQLEADPDLAGPWHQLFNQVQIPRHVVSELLQNADDANATEAFVDIKGDEFVFSHNGEDFTEEHFASLCRFGYSNKRLLHTIGFRGVGFKSAFSLGDEVRLLTPTLSVAFRRQRFTEPLWVGGPHPSRTEVRVLIKDYHREYELRKNLLEWLRSPTSILFLRHIRSLRVGDQEVGWVSHGDGPIQESEWMAVSTEPDSRYLLLRSPAEKFPEESLEEIREERMIYPEEEGDFPPCRVEIVLGIEARLFVILPTGVKTTLPFACNAPFVQDPARVKIKDPGISPTNRWLLQRAGELAANGMLPWLSRTDLTIDERSAAYDLLPDVDRSDASLEGTCASIIEESFEESIQHQDWLLAEGGGLEPWEGCVAVPSTLLEIWSPQQVATDFVKDELKILCRSIAPGNWQKLIHWGAIQELQKSEIIETLEAKQLSRPTTWQQLLILWAYVSTDLGSYYHLSHKGVCIVPVQGKEWLFAAADVVRFGDKRLLDSESDWEFLGKYLLVLNPNWPRFLAEQRRQAQDQQDIELGKLVKAAYDVLTALNLDNASDVSRVMDRVAADFFSPGYKLSDCVRLAQLAAALDVSVSQSFRFVTTDGYLNSIDQPVLVDIDGQLADFLDEDWCKTYVLHEAYSGPFTSCTQDEWKGWISSGHSRLVAFPPLQQTHQNLWGQSNLLKVLQERGFKESLSFPYVRENFEIKDWDFGLVHWEHWRSQAAKDSAFWSRVLEQIFRQPPNYWSKALSANVYQIATTGNKRAITYSTILPTWIMKLRELPCVEDTWGAQHIPAEVLRRTADTEVLLNVEPFVRADLDTEATRPLLVSLGLRDTPTGPDRLLERLRAIARDNTPPIHEVEKWYYRLDQMLVKASTDDLETVRSAFASEKLILIENNGWGRTNEVFLANDEAVPDAAVIRSSVKHLSLWNKIGVAERPTIDLVIDWLKSLRSGDRLTPDEARRVSSLLPRYPNRIWDECRHWLNLEGEWVSTANLSFALSMQSLVPWKHLFPVVKQRSADLQRLSAEVCQQQPFAQLRLLSEAIEEHFSETLIALPQPQRKPWLNALACGLSRVVLENQEETQRIRELATRLSQTAWLQAAKLQTIPYIDGTPAGTPRHIEVLWKDSRLYVEDRSAPKMAKAVAAEIGRVFARPDMTDAVKLCYDRSPEFVAEYLEENFQLADLNPEPQEPAPAGDHTETQRPSANGSGDLSGKDIPEAEGPQLSEAIEEPELESESREDEDTGEDGEQPTHPRRKRPIILKPSLMERFALARGYFIEGTDRFYHPDGSCIARVSGNAFPWERRSASGDILQYYWPRDHCIRREPLEMEADVWSLCQEFPDTYTLVLCELDGSPVEISGRRLLQMSEKGELTLHPATYRLVYKHEPVQEMPATI
jgi:hypothetical protein